MFEPVVHYLVESVRVCAHVADLSVVELAAYLLGFVAVFLGVAALRARVRR